MAVQLAGAFLPALAKVGALKLPLLLRGAGIAAGAAPGLMRGDLGSALIGGGLGGLGTLGLGSAAGMGVSAANKAIFAQAAKRGLAGTAGAQALQGLATAGIPLGIGALAGGSAANILGGPAKGIAGGAAGLAGYKTIGNEGLGGTPLPLGMGPYGNIGPTGYPLDVLSPLGLDAGRRLRTVKDAETLRDATNIVLPTVRKFSEQAKKDDFARSIAARGIAQNIATNAALTQNMQQAGLNLGTTAAQQAGQALTQQYTY